MPLLVCLEKVGPIVEPGAFTFRTCKTSQHPSTSGVLYLEINLVPIRNCLISD